MCRWQDWASQAGSPGAAASPGTQGAGPADQPLEGTTPSHPPTQDRRLTMSCMRCLLEHSGLPVAGEHSVRSALVSAIQGLLLHGLLHALSVMLLDADAGKEPEQDPETSPQPRLSLGLSGLSSPEGPRPQAAPGEPSVAAMAPCCGVCVPLSTETCITASSLASTHPGNTAESDTASSKHQPCVGIRCLQLAMCRCLRGKDAAEPGGWDAAQPAAWTELGSARPQAAGCHKTLFAGNKGHMHLSQPCYSAQPDR